MNDKTELYRGEFYTMTENLGDGFKRTLTIEPGYNDTEPSRYGKHGMGFTFMLIGPEGATQFRFNAGWVPGEKSLSPMVSDCYPMGVDLGHHWRTPTYEGEGRYGDPKEGCHALGIDQCYYDGSGLRADDVLAEFIKHGASAVWSALRSEYDYCSEQARVTEASTHPSKRLDAAEAALERPATSQEPVTWADVDKTTVTAVQAEDCPEWVGDGSGRNIWWRRVNDEDATWLGMLRLVESQVRITYYRTLDGVWHKVVAE